jgi:glycosyltransferase involved in cell wall biosynthesis
MKSVIVNYSDISGGAARAAYRIHNALRWYGVESRMLVGQALSGDYTVECLQTKIAEKVWAKVGGILVGALKKTYKTGNSVLHSPAIISTRLSSLVNDFDADVIHLHWFNHGLISIADIGKINKPLIWTLHDMWGFCGAEHYTQDFRWRDGYTTTNRPKYESGFDLNRWTWARKIKNWKRPMQVVTPSQWLAECAQQSVLMRDWPISVIPNAIDTNVWQPVNKVLARQLLGLPLDVPLLLFGAIGGANDPRKGFDLLQAALVQLRGQLPGLELVVFGQMTPKTPVNLGFPVHYTGHLHDDVSLRLHYCAADLTVVPSRQEAFGQTASESHACGTPVVAFNATGLSDIVEQRKTGYLAKAFDPADLAFGITWVLNDSERQIKLGQSARARAVKLWSYETVASQYLSIYCSSIDAS